MADDWKLFSSLAAVSLTEAKFSFASLPGSYLVSTYGYDIDIIRGRF